MNPADLFLDEESKKIMADHNLKRKEGVSSAYEVPIKTKNGEVKWLIISGAPYFDKAGKLLGTFGLHLDISDRKKMESDLLLAKLKAEELNRVKELFLANVSHEIRTPMNAIIGMTELLKESELNKNQTDYLGAIEKASEGLLALINDVLDFSKIESGEITVIESEFNLYELIDNVKQTLSYKADQNGVSIEVGIDKKVPPYIKGDKAKLNQVLLNLVSNAVKFTKNGSVHILINLIKLKRDKASIEFLVVDEGIGISGEDMASIFENFKQANPSISREYGGTGLGLPISQNIVKLLGGEILVKSEIGKGSEFSFEIDFTIIENMKLKEEGKVIVDFKEAQILVVEDNPVNMLMVSTALKKWNCLMQESSNGLEAIEALKKNQFDLILMDLQMPKMGGIEACEIIRGKMKIDTPIIALTANAIEGDDQKCIDAGMNDYLSKPFKQKDLNVKLNKWLSS
jgi:CheY-like chemotaxis protein/nitrogen-specific signal transduction histidine kinase